MWATRLELPWVKHWELLWAVQLGLQMELP
jgi:hypothetical protein